MVRENFSIGAFYNRPITKNQDNPIKTVGRDSFLSPNSSKPLKYKFLGVTRGHQAPRGRTAPIF